MTDNTEPLPSKPLDPPAQDEVEAVANVLAATMRAGRGINDSDVFVTMATAAITALRQHQTAETEALRGENARLREALKALLDACYQADGLEELPECIDGTLLDDADAALELQYPVRHLTRAEFKQFFAEVKADHARLYVMIGIYTMARPGAILELTWDRVDFMRRQIDFTPPGHARTAKRRTIVPIADSLLTELQAGKAAATTEWVIERGGKPVACIKKAFQAASERSGVHATPYTLRHTGAVWAAEAGVPMAELAQFMGHDDDRTTSKHYARFSPDHLRGVANRIGAVA